MPGSSPNSSRGIDYELLLAGMFAAFVAAAYALPAPLLAALGCPFKRITGVPCLTCGSTRAVEALKHGDVWAAVALNPLVTVAFAAWALFALYGAVVVALKLPRLTPRPGLARPAAFAILALALINWVYLIAAGV